MTKIVRTLMFALIVTSLVLTACAPAATQAPEPTTAPPTEAPSTTVPEPTTAATEAPAEDPLAMYAPDAVSGDIIAAGSSTVFPLAERMKQRFEEEGYAGNITIDSIGSGAGFERFCKNGETDIATASRAIKEEEVANCAALSPARTPVEFAVGLDAIAVVVSSENDFATDVTLEELAQIFSTAKNWSDVRPEWPNEPILRFSPGTDSGTFDFFVEKVTGPANPDADGKADLAKGEEVILNAEGIQLSEDDNVLVQGVEGSPYAIGYFGYAFYKENQGKLKTLSIGGIEPNEETAESGEYPLARPLFLYSDAGIMQEKPQVASYIWFFLNNVNNEIADVGYFPVSDAKLQEAIDTWNAAVGVEGAAAPSEAPAASNETPAMYAPDAVSGDIIAAGSSTVFPLAERMKQRFEEEGFSGNITIDSIGSGAGLERFCKTGETDIATASRPIKDSETESCAALSPARTPIPFQVGIDALSVVVSSENDFATDVTKEELAQIFSTATNWSDVRPEWPNEPILRFSPGTDSGTFDYFVEAIMGPANLGADGKADLAKGEEAILNAEGIQLSEDDNVLVQGVEGSPYAIGYFGFAYYQENQGNLKALSIGGVEPNAETAESGEYPLARPLFLYSDAAIMQDKPQVASYIWFFLNNVNNEISDVGYFPVSDAKLQEGIDAWNAAVVE